LKYQGKRYVLKKPWQRYARHGFLRRKEKESSVGKPHLVENSLITQFTPCLEVVDKKESSYDLLINWHFLTPYRHLINEMYAREISGVADTSTSFEEEEYNVFIVFSFSGQCTVT
jgi:hypothetical protein